MSEPSTKTETFDVFLCHNSEDKPEIREIARRLDENGIKPWLDEKQIRPGTSWQTALGEQIDSIKSAAVFVGESGIGPWQDQEIQALISAFTERKCPVIPVILSSAKEEPDLPWTLKNRHRVDFRVSNPDPLEQLIWGIAREKPDKNELSKKSSYSNSDIPKETDLFPPKEKKVIELRLSSDLDEFTDEAKMVLLDSLNKLMNIGDVKLTKVAAGSVRLYLELDPEDADKIYSADKEGRLDDLGISEARLYPAIADPPETEQRSQLLVLLDRVNEYWIDGVLKNSLYNEVLISLGKHAMDEAVEPPWKHFIELPDQRRHLVLKDRSIKSVFDATGLLLILGEPGSGKTTTLLNLASSLISRAREDLKERVPMVLNLSSWKKKQTLTEWIIEELSGKYRVPVKIGRSWLKNDYLLPLLDGLDEVKNTLRPDCVAAINDFIEQLGPSGLVVCCRLVEYQWLPERLKLNGAICLELLGVDEVNEFLNSGGSKLAELQCAMRIDPVLQELAQTPLMLSIMSLAYEGVGADDLTKQKADSHEESREQIFNLYVERMFQRKGLVKSPFPKGTVINWLAQLAKGMKEHSQSVFMVEELQPNWLNTRGQRIAYGIITALTIAVIFGLSLGLLVGPSDGLAFGLSIFVGVRLACWLESPLRRGLVSALVFGVVGGLITWLSEWLFFVPIGWSNLNRLWFFKWGAYTGLVLNNGLSMGLIGGVISGIGVGSLNVITPVETLRWDWKLFWRKSIQGLKIGLIVGLIVGLSVGVIFSLIGWLSSLHFFLRLDVLSDWLNGLGFNWLIDILIVGIILGGIGGIVGWEFGGLLGGMTDSVRIDKTSPNQGIYLSLKNSVISICIVGGFLGMIGGIIGGMIDWRIDRTFHEANLEVSYTTNLRLITGIIIGLGIGLIGSLNRGGSAVIKHCSLRFILWIKGYTPFKFIQFLDHCAKLILLKKVGGGYMFIHRLLLEHFAKMELKSTKAKMSK